MGHEAEQLVGAYVLGALDVKDRLALESHLEECEPCQELLRQYEAVTEGLLAVPAPVGPPRRVRKNLEAQLRGPSLGPVRVGIAQAALAGVAGFLVIVNLLLFTQTRDLSRQSEIMLNQQQAGQTALALASYPSSQVLTFREESVRGSLVYDPEFPVAVLNAWGLPELSGDETYQVWLIGPEGDRASGALFNAAQGQEFVSVLIESPTPFGEFLGFGVTIEPAVGSQDPTGPRVLGAEFANLP